MSNQLLAVKPDRTKLYGITHELDGTPRTKQVRVLKVGIGVPVGKDVHVYINAENKWVIVTGIYNQKREEKVERFDTKDEAWKHYVAARKTAPERKYPRKLGYFTFLHL